MLYDIFDLAIENEFCIRNPVKSIIITSDKPKNEKKSYTLAKSNLILKSANNGDKWGLCVYIALTMGLRRGEILGLKWSDIDLEEKTMHILRAVEPDTKGEPQDGELKSKDSNRILPFNNDVSLVLKDVQRKSDYVIAGNTKWGYTSIYGFDKGYKKYMKELTDKLELPYLSPHELRHTCGTVMREKGIDLYTISRFLGHSDSKITGSTYVHNDIEVLRKRLYP